MSDNAIKDLAIKDLAVNDNVINDNVMNEDTNNSYNILKDVSAKKISWLKTGGTIKELFEPKTIEELANFLKESAQSHEKIDSYRVLGACTNTLLPDTDIPFIIKLNHLQKMEVKKMETIVSHDDYKTVYAQAGVLSSKLIRFCLENNLCGLEFIATIPGTVGGMIKMNAGAYGAEIKDVLQEAVIVEQDGSIKHYSASELEFAYRHSGVKDTQIIIAGIFKVKDCLTEESKNESKAKIIQMQEHRKASQPLQRRSLGSTFKNPVQTTNTGELLAAWKLIDECGLRGYKIGDAQVSEKHTNFIENVGNATSQDVLSLIKLIQSKVSEKFGIMLEIENEIL